MVFVNKYVFKIVKYIISPFLLHLLQNILLNLIVEISSILI